MADEKTRREQLALFLRTRRDQLQPEDVGLERRGRRRVPGLRREEVAELAFVSVTWYTWLEQARDMHASAQALDSVCRVLQLDDDSRHYVRRLAGRPTSESQETPTGISPALEALLADVHPSSACVVTGAYDLLAWNQAYVALLGDPAELPRERRNLVWMSFRNDRIRSHTSDWPDVAKATIAYLRDEASKNPNDPRIRSVIADLSETSSEFREAWDLWEVRRSLSLVLTIEHPDVGTFKLQVLQLVPSDEPGLKLIVLYPVDDASRDRLSAWVSRWLS